MQGLSLREVYVAQKTRGRLDVYVVADGYSFRLGHEGCEQAKKPGHLDFEEVLPESFQGAVVCGVRSDGESLLVKLDCGRFLCFDFTIDTETGEGIESLSFVSEPTEVSELAEYYLEIPEQS